MEKTRSCFFIGHRDAKDTLLPALIAEVERHPNVTLIHLRPYRPADRPEETPKGFDGPFHPPGMERVPTGRDPQY